MNTRFFRGLLIGLLAVSSAVPALSLPAQAAVANTAIRGSGTAVYWYANDGRRYVFPNAGTYYSWFPSFSNVVRVSDSELSAIPLAGNVTYRPGAKLVKVQTDPKVYAVSRFGILHWVTGEVVASQLYGYNWSQKIQDIPDTFFINYTIGSPIWNTWDYNVSNEYNGVSNPSDSISYNQNTYTSYNSNTYNPYYNSSNTGYGLTGTARLTLSRTNASTNDPVTVTATVDSLSTSIASTVIRIYDDRTGYLLRTCTGYWSCSTTNVVTATPGSSQRYYADVSDYYGSALARVYSPYVYVDTSNGSNLYGTVTVSADRTTVNYGESASFNTYVNAYNGSVQNLIIRLYNERDGSLVRTCTGTTSCSYSTTIYSGSYNFRIYADVTNDYGATLPRAYSPYVYVNGNYNNNNYNYNNNYGTFSGTASVSADRTTVNAYDTVTFTTYVTNYNVSTQGLTIRMYDERNGALLRTCTGTSTCTASAAAGNQSSSFRTYADVTSDTYGGSLPRAYSPYVYVNQQNNGGSYYNGTLTGMTDIYLAPAARINSTVYVTASITNANVSASNLTIRIYDSRYGNTIGSCTGAYSCSIPFTIGGSPINTSAYATFSDQNGNALRSTDVSIIAN